MTPEELIAQLRDPGVPFTERRDRIARLPDSRATIAAALDKATAAADWEAVEYLLMAAAAQPDPGYVPALSRALRSGERQVPVEDALEVLAAIADPGTVGLLKDVALTEHDWDEFDQIGMKAVRALRRIRTPESTSALAELAERGSENVRALAGETVENRR
ncbi:HEAT repeat domain-containing protein [Phaeacidiphilus oryzae]|uniref:hypothetical protein n=1 Tax=Phaeacidiphilus oryzae TaxID=348818 RepID=UPI00055FA291|nr:hypothetical protein [Phaeacidiphilus oryzae]